MRFTRVTEIEEADALALARAFGITAGDIGLRLGVTSDWVRQLAHNPRHSGRVRRAVLQMALERERLAEVLS